MRSIDAIECGVLVPPGASRRSVPALGLLAFDLPSAIFLRAAGDARLVARAVSSYQLPSPRADRVPMTVDDIRRASRLVSDHLDPDVIDAIARTESRETGFLQDGRPRILYERHHFRRHSGGRFDAFPDLSHPSPSGAGGYGTYVQQYEKLQRALELDVEAALSSCSWGRFQVMGSHATRMGYSSVRHLVREMYRSEAAHLECFVRYWKHVRSGAVKSLVDRNWEAIARAYNGRDFRSHRYDTRLRDNWHRAKAERIAGSGLSASVGEGGDNSNVDDVLAVQVLLQINNIRQGGRIDGRCGPRTIDAIRAFQRLFLPTQDGLVEPGGDTWARLIRRVK